VNNILVTNDPDLDHIDEEIFNGLHGKPYRQIKRMLWNRATIEDISFVPDPGKPTIKQKICPDTVDRLMPFIPFCHGAQNKVENMSLRDVEEFLSLEMDDPSEPTHHTINSTSTDLNTSPLQHPFAHIDDRPKCIFLKGGTSHGRTEGMVFIDRTLHVRVFQLALMIEASSNTAHDSTVNTNPIWFDDVPFINNSFDLSNAKIGFGNQSLQYDRGTDDDNGERFRYDIITTTCTWGEKQKNTEGGDINNIGRIINSGVCAFAEEESHYSDTVGGRLWRERWIWGAHHGVKSRAISAAAHRCHGLVVITTTALP
jgi:hypothetical protein